MNERHSCSFVKNGAYSCDGEAGKRSARATYGLRPQCDARATSAAPQCDAPATYGLRPQCDARATSAAPQCDAPATYGLRPQCHAPATSAAPQCDARATYGLRPQCHARVAHLGLGLRFAAICAVSILPLAASTASAQPAPPPAQSAPAPSAAVPSAPTSGPASFPPQGYPPGPPQGYPPGPPQGYPPGYGPPPGYPPGYGPPPGYSPYSYPAPYPYYAEPPPTSPTLPYDEGQQIPPGYHLERRVQKGLTIAGASILGGAWILSIGGAAALVDKDDGYAPLFVPLVGPFITLGTRNINFNQDTILGAILLFDGFAQLAGGTMMLVGLFKKTPLLVLDKNTNSTAAPQVSVLPEVNVGLGHASFTWRY